MAKKVSKELKELYRDLSRILEPYDTGPGTIMMQVRIFDIADDPQPEPDWEELLDEIYGPDRHRLKIAVIKKAPPIG